MNFSATDVYSKIIAPDVGEKLKICEMIDPITASAEAGTKILQV